MASVNKAILVGNLGQDPTIRTIDGGVKVATFSLATTESYMDRNNQPQEKTEWHRIVLWRGLAEIAEKYLRKGAKVYIEGKITTRQYEQDGVTKYVTEIVGSNMVMMGSRSGDSAGYNDYVPPVESNPYSGGSSRTTSSTNSASSSSSSSGFNTNQDSSEDDLPF